LTWWGSPGNTVGGQDFKPEAQWGPRQRGAGVADAIGALSPGNDFQRGLLGISEALIKNRWAVVVDSKSSVPFLFLVICHKGKVSEARKTFSFPYLIYHRETAILKT
jgi:hypothetical protein